MSALDLLKRDIDPDEEGSVVPEIAEQSVQGPSKDLSTSEVETRVPVCEDVFCDALTVEQADLRHPSETKKPPHIDHLKSESSGA